MIRHVRLSQRAQKQLQCVPRHIATKLKEWVNAVEHDGLQPTRTVPGFHDEPLHGPRKGQRSIRLNRAYRAIYAIRNDVWVEVRFRGGDPQT